MPNLQEYNKNFPLVSVQELHFLHPFIPARISLGRAGSVGFVV